MVRVLLKINIVKAKSPGNKPTNGIYQKIYNPILLRMEIFGIPVPSFNAGMTLPVIRFHEFSQLKLYV